MYLTKNVTVKFFGNSYDLKSYVKTVKFFINTEIYNFIHRKLCCFVIT